MPLKLPYLFLGIFSIFIGRYAWYNVKRSSHDYSAIVKEKGMPRDSIVGYYKAKYDLDVSLCPSDALDEFYSFPFIRTYSADAGGLLEFGVIKPCVHYITDPASHLPSFIESSNNPAITSPLNSMVQYSFSDSITSESIVVLGVTLNNPDYVKLVRQAKEKIESAGAHVKVISFDIPSEQNDERVKILLERSKRAARDGYALDYYYVEFLKDALNHDTAP